MPKSQKKSVAHNSKPQVTRKSSKSAEKASVKITKPVKGAKPEAQPKTTKKIATVPEKSPRNSKQSRILALLQRPSGATVDEMAKATDWQRHSVQGMMSGVLKKRLGMTITSAKEEHGRVYRIAGGRA
jgi:hypothetical protein